jgi:hypothetical protein
MTDLTEDAKVLRRRLDKLSNLMREVVTMLEDRTTLRCPYRTARDDCAFAGRCQNQALKAQGLSKCCGAELNCE